MNNEYVRNLLRQETINTFGYPPESGVIENWYSGNDYYNDILVNRENQITKINNTIQNTQAYLEFVTDEKLIESLKNFINRLENRKEKLKIFGYNSIKYTYETGSTAKSRFPYLESRKDELALRFKYTYGNMRIAFNTAEQFNDRLQAIFDNIAPEYENRLRLQALYEKQILNDEHKLIDLDTSDITNTDNTSDTFYFNEQDPEIGRKALQNKSTVSTKSKTLQSQVKNIMSGYMLNQTVLKEYLDEFGDLFIRVWGDRTRW